MNARDRLVAYWAARIDATDPNSAEAIDVRAEILVRGLGAEVAALRQKRQQRHDGEHRDAPVKADGS